MKRTLPKDYEGAWTLLKSVVRKGIGLHSGKLSEVHLHPSEHEGFYVSWMGSSDEAIRIQPHHVLTSQLCTTLQLGNHRLSTVEHLLAALAGCGLTHINIEVSGEEIPLLDGSALQWVDAILDAGIVEAETPRQSKIKLEGPLVLHRGNSVITATPSEIFRLVGIIDFPYPAIGRQSFTIELNPISFAKEIAPARTFGFKDQLEQLQNSGLIKGGNLDNALVCNDDQWLNPPLRFKDEPVRHKLLDLIGDLSLAGFPKAQVLVYKGSHALHIDLASALLQE